jgi:hypothetical protein
LADSILVACFAICLSAALMAQESAALVDAEPHELPSAVLHNPDMGWVIYENYPLDQNPQGSSTLLSLPREDFPQVDAVALMFSWQDVEKHPGVYDFSKVDYAYDYWAKRGKAIQLRVSATTLMWWTSFNPPSGKGAPDYVREHMPAAAKQTRKLEGRDYDVEDARDPHYRERLKAFLHAIDEHFSEARPVTLVDLRGFGLWGEWHSGFQYPNLEERREALKGIIDVWTEAFPKRRLALSASYDPDSPPELYEGTNRKFDPGATKRYDEFLRYSAFDYALTKSNVSFRRDGCGGAVHSNERKLIDEAFRLGRGPMFSEFVDGYASSKAGGPKWVEWKIDDALSLHPNYINVLGWQGGDTMAFLRERPDLVSYGLQQMGYRLVPTKVTHPAVIKNAIDAMIKCEWVNRGVGRAPRDFELQILLIGHDGRIAATASAGDLPTSRWVAFDLYQAESRAKFTDVAPGEYQLALRLFDVPTKRNIALPLADTGPDGSYLLGKVTVTAP